MNDMDDSSRHTAGGDAARLRFGRAPEGARLPDGLRLGPVRLQVSDLQRSERYYTEVLGLSLLERTEERALLGSGAVEIKGEGAAGGGHPLVELHEHPGAAPVPRRGRLGLFHFAILLPDRAPLGSLLAHLAELGVRAGASDHRVSEAIYLQDPDGLGIEVYADRPRGEWSVADGQLVMATDPLDVEALIRAANGVPWKGMPAGTVIGHVHLHVGDLEKAEAFYHQGLGFDKVVWSYPGALFLSAGGYHHHLGVNTWAVGAAPAGANHARLLEWEIRVPMPGEAAAALERLRVGGHPVELEAGGGTARDPWDTRLRIVPERAD
jgi:catechol 2,3-dioxygenase